MSRKPATSLLSEKPPQGESDSLARHWEDKRVEAAHGGRWGRWLRRAVGFLAVAALAGGLFGHSSLSSLMPARVPARLTTETGPPTAPEGSRKLVVCFGYADVEGGVVTLHPSQPGRVEEVLVKENDMVPEGAPLLRLDDRAARYRLEEAKAILDEAAARLAKSEKGPEQFRLKIAEQRATLMAARYRLAAAQRTLAARKAQIKVESFGRKRDDPVTTEELASTAERVKEFEENANLEQSKLSALEVQDPRVEVERVRAEVATTRARLREAERTLDEHTLRAPEAGKVLRISVARGEFLTTPPKKMTIQFCPNQPRIIRAEVDQAFASRVEVGQPALVEDDGTTGPAWRGHVVHLSDWYTQRRQIADEQLQLKDVRTFECLIALEPGQPSLRIGQRVRVTISRAEPPDH